MTEPDIKFVLMVENYILANPHIVGETVFAIQRGITNAFAEASSRAADMETTAAITLNARLFKGNETFIADKLEKWKGKTALRWGDQLAALRSKAK